MSFLPVASVLVMVIALRVELYASMAVVMAGLFVVYRYPPKKIWGVLQKGFSLHDRLVRPAMVIVSKAPD